MRVQAWTVAIGMALWCVAPPPARADTVFDFNATLTQAGVANPGTGTLKGTLTFNTATGALDGLTLTFTNPGTNPYNTAYNLNFVFGGPTYGGVPTEYGILGNVNPYQAALFLYLPVAAPLIGYAGGPICSVAFACISSQDGTTRDNSGVSVAGGSSTLPSANVNYTVDAGTLTAETPEPSSLVLMATGVGGLVGLIRRRERGRRAGTSTRGFLLKAAEDERAVAGF